MILLSFIKSIRNTVLIPLYYDKVVRLATRIKQRSGMTNNRNVYWSHYEPKNFGDWVTPYLYKKMTGNEPLYCPPGRGLFTTTIFGAGSILRHLKSQNTAIVWGSGIISAKDNFEKPKKTLAVRGPHTRKRFHELGFDCPEVYGDPAILLPLFYSPSKTEKKKYAMGIIPHFINFRLAKELFGIIDGAVIIDVTQPLEKVVDNINECEMTVSSSLHGLIVSHAYGIPSAWIEFGEPLMGDGTKFQDYFSAFRYQNKVEATTVNEKFTLQDLIALVTAAENPEHKGLVKPLLEVCPFNVRTEIKSQKKFNA